MGYTNVASGQGAFLAAGTPLVGLAGGYLASLIGWPLPWMVGSLLAIILVRCLTPWQLMEIPGGRKCGQWVVGIGIGLHFTPVVMEQVLSHFGLIFFGALITSVSSVVSVWLMRRTGEDRATAFFSSMPGGSGEMVNLGARNGAMRSRPRPCSWRSCCTARCCSTPACTTST